MRRPTPQEVRYHAARWSWVVALAVLAYIAFPSSATDLAPLLKIGVLADRDVAAPFDFVVPKTDEELKTEAEELARTARPIYQYQQRTYDSAAAAMHGFFDALEAAAGQGPAAIIRVARAHGVNLTPAEAAYLARGGKRRALERALDDLFSQTLAQGATAQGALQGEDAPQFIIRRGANESPVGRDQVLTFNQYLLRARSLHPDPGSSVGDVVYLKLVRRFFRPTLVRNEAETARRRTELIGSVEPSKYVVRQGERLISAREIVSNAAHEKLLALHSELVRRGAATSHSIGGVLGPILRDGMILSIFWVLLLLYRRETYREQRQVALVALLFAASILGAAAVARSRAIAHPELIPLPFMAMMLTVLFNGRVSMIAAMILSALIGIQPVFHDTPALFLCLIGGVTAALSVRSLRRRSHLYTAVLIVGAGYLAGAIALGLTGDWPLIDIGWTALFGMFNALVSASLTILLLPLAESLTHVTTDLTLLELSDPSRPLLRRLSLEAPGTYAHSIAMANLVEAACNRVGANGLLGRVGCYYHDVGKLSNPQYFVENQTHGTNPHDRIPPAQSAKIIKQHVIDGLALADEAKLPDVVAAFIPEHHGTTEITYFYDRAKKQGVPASRDEYRYPGPRPRSMETAIAMIADSVEAALRVLDDLTPAKIEAAIEQIVKGKLAAGQLDEAPMTLQQLDQVKAEFIRVLSGMYHNRIDYPESSGGITKAWQPSQQATGL
jgi:putative nucleotidyltransferase with HDIG domain